MRNFWLLLLFLLAGCYYPYGPYYSYPYPTYPYGYAPSYYGPGAPTSSYGYQPPYPSAQQPSYGNLQPGYSAPGNDPNNCGTPDEPKPCYRMSR